MTERLYDPYTTPQGPGFISVDLTSNSPTMSNTAMSGKIHTRQVAGQKWAFSIRYPEVTKSQFQNVYLQLLKLRGRLNEIKVVLPQYREPQNGSLHSSAGTNGNALIQVATSGTAGVSTISTKNWNSASFSGNELVAGDVVAFQDNKKVHIITSMSDTGSFRQLTLFPPLTKTVAANKYLYTYEVPFYVTLKNDIQEYALGINNLYSISLDLEETGDYV